MLICQKSGRPERKAQGIMDIYAEDIMRRLKVTDYSGLPKKECDMTGEMIDFSQGFDDYIASLEERIQLLMQKQKKEAIELLAMILSLRQPYSMILYLRYYRKTAA